MDASERADVALLEVKQGIELCGPLGFTIGWAYFPILKCKIIEAIRQAEADVEKRMREPMECGHIRANATDDFRWLIEAHGPTYLRGTRDGMPQWTQNAWEAEAFADREEAERQIAEFQGEDRISHFWAAVKVIEHGFVDAKCRACAREQRVRAALSLCWRELAYIIEAPTYELRCTANTLEVCREARIVLDQLGGE